MKMNIKGNTPAGFEDEADEFAKKLAALVEGQEIEEDGPTDAPASEIGIFPKQAKAAQPFTIRGTLAIATDIPKRKEEAKSKALSSDHFRRLQTLFTVSEEPPEGEEAKPLPILSVRKDDIERTTAYRVEWPDGFAIEDAGHSLNIYARAGILPMDGATVCRLFQFADGIGFWDRSPTFWADGVGEWAKAAYLEAFHLSRPIVPAVSLSPREHQKRQWWLGVLREFSEEAKEYKGTQRGEEAKGKADYMRQIFDQNSRQPPAVHRGG